MGGGLPFPSLLCAPPAAIAASSHPSPRRDTYHGQAAPRGRAGRRRRGLTSPGPWPRRERVVTEGATVDDGLAPGLAWLHPTRDGRGVRLSLLRLWGAVSAIRGHFGEGGVPGAAGYTLGAGGGAARGRRSLHLPGWCPLQDLRGEGGAARAVPRPDRHWRLAGCLEPSAGFPSPGPSSNPNSLEGVDFQHKLQFIRFR